MREEKTKPNIYKRIKILNYTSFSLLLVITLLFACFSKLYATSINKVNANIEVQWRDEARDKAKYLAQQLELSISKDNLNYWDDSALHEWAEEVLLPMKVGGDGSNIILVNVGYSVREWDDLNWFSVKEDLGIVLDPDASSEIGDHFKNIELKGKSNMWVKEYIDSFADDFSTLHNIEYETLVTGLRQVLFVKNKIIMDTTPSSILNDRFSNSRFIEDYLMSDSDSFEINYNRLMSGQESMYYDRTVLNTTGGIKWLEWDIVPPNKLGWELQSPHIEGVENVGYKKIAIIVEIDEDEIEDLYTDLFTWSELVQVGCRVAVVSLSVITVIILFITFYKFLVNDSK